MKSSGRDTRKQETWLVGFYLGVGDIVCAHSWIIALAREHSEIILDVAIGPRAVAASRLMRWPANVNFVLFALPRLGNLKKLIAFLSTVSHSRYDRVLNSPHPPVQATSWKVPVLLAFLRLMGRVRRVEGAADDRLSWLYNKRYPVSRRLPFDVRDRVFFQLAGLLPLDVEKSEAIFDLPVTDDGSIGIHVGVSRANRRWPARHVAELCVLLAEAYPERTILLFGLESEIRPVREFALPDSVSVFSGTFDQAVERVASLSLIVTHDSGFMHIAAALDKPLVAIFGASSVSPHLPTSPKATAVQDIILSCQPCDLKRCLYADNYCMQLLEPQRVFDVIRQKLVAAAA